MAPILRLVAVATLFASMVVNASPMAVFPEHSALVRDNASNAKSTENPGKRAFEVLSKRGSNWESKIITACKTPGTVAITFDDGPFEYTGKLLDILKKEGVHTTFFMNGNNYGKILDSKYQAIVKRADAEGHQVASHTWDHADLSKLSKEKILDEMTKIDNAFFTILEKKPVYMRPPYGNVNEIVVNTLSEAGYKIVKWNIDTQDWEHPTTLKENLQPYKDALGAKGAINKGFIGLEHDVYKETALQLSVDAIKYAKSLNFKIVPVATCLGDTNPRNWYRS